MRCPSIICFICFLACFRLSIHARTHHTYDSAPDSIYHLGIEKAKIGRFSDAKDCFLKYLSLEDSLSESEYYYVTEGIAYCYNQLGIKDSVLFYNEDYLFPPIEKSSLYILCTDLLIIIFTPMNLMMLFIKLKSVFLSNNVSLEILIF